MLVKGWIIWSLDFKTETLFSVTPDGRTFTTGPLNRPNDVFSKSARKWTLCDGKPDNAEFIGNYHVDNIH